MAATFNAKPADTSGATRVATLTRPPAAIAGNAVPSASVDATAAVTAGLLAHTSANDPHPQYRRLAESAVGAALALLGDASEGADGLPGPPGPPGPAPPPQTFLHIDGGTSGTVVPTYVFRFDFGRSA